MIYFITCGRQQDNLKPLIADLAAPKVATLRYDEALSKELLPRATYIFTAMGLLRPNDLTAAARLYRQLRESGCRVLNDPARVKTRLPLLRALYRTGINSFNVYSAEEEERPNRFPVFLRIPHGSKPPVTDLIHDQSILDRALEAAIADGIPRQNLMIVEYAAEPVRPGVFRKGSVYRIGDHFVPDIWWYGTSWIVKGDRDGLADEELYLEELQIMRDNKYDKCVEKAFEIASIDYGRLDFGLVDGRPCIYEVNTNPELFGVRTHPVSQRAESIRIKWGKLLAAFHEIDTSTDADEMVEVQGIRIEASTEAPSLRFHQLRLSYEHERRGNMEAALKAAEAEIATNPESVRALTQLSRMLLKHDRLDDAIAALRQAVRLSPRKVSEQRRLAVILWRSGRFEEMQQQLRHAIDYGVDQWQVHLLLSKVCQRLGDDPHAIEAAKQAARVAYRDADHRSGTELCELSRILARYKHLEEAIAILQLAVQLRPSYRHRLATLLIEAGRFEEARDHLLKTLASDKEHWNTHLLLSRVYEKLGDTSAALDALRRAAELGPTEPAVAKRLKQRRRFNQRAWPVILLRAGIARLLGKTRDPVLARDPWP